MRILRPRTQITVSIGYGETMRYTVMLKNHCQKGISYCGGFNVPALSSEWTTEEHQRVVMGNIKGEIPFKEEMLKFLSLQMRQKCQDYQDGSPYLRCKYSLGEIGQRRPGRIQSRDVTGGRGSLYMDTNAVLLTTVPERSISQHCPNNDDRVSSVKIQKLQLYEILNRPKSQSVNQYVQSKSRKKKVERPSWYLPSSVNTMPYKQIL